MKMFVLALSVFIFNNAFATSFPPIAETTSQYGVRRIYSTYNLTTTAWSPIISSTTYSISSITVFDSCGQVLRIGSAPAGSASGSEINNSILVFPGGGGYGFSAPSGSRISYIAVSANCTSSSTENDTDFFI